MCELYSGIVYLVNIEIILETIYLCFYKFSGTLSHTEWIFHLMYNFINCLKVQQKI